MHDCIEQYVHRALSFFCHIMIVENLPSKEGTGMDRWGKPLEYADKHTAKKPLIFPRLNVVALPRLQ